MDRNSNEDEETVALLIDTITIPPHDQFHQRGCAQQIDFSTPLPAASAIEPVAVAAVESWLLVLKARSCYGALVM